jgi:hypothetical protein
MSRVKENLPIIQKCKECQNECKKYVSDIIFNSLKNNKAWFSCIRFEKIKEKGD